jgi:hypothetical protein
MGRLLSKWFVAGFLGLVNQLISKARVSYLERDGVAIDLGSAMATELCK